MQSLTVIVFFALVAIVAAQAIEGMQPQDAATVSEVKPMAKKLRDYGGRTLPERKKKLRDSLVGLKRELLKLDALIRPEASQMKTRNSFKRSVRTHVNKLVADAGWRSKKFLGHKVRADTSAQKNDAKQQQLAKRQIDEVTCGDGQIIDLSEEEFYWYSPGWIDGDDYPENKECKVTFRVKARHNFEIVDISNFDVNGDYYSGCEGGDYVQFTINGKKSKKFCGEGSQLSDEWCWEDWCWPNTFEQVGNAEEDMLVEAVFKSTKRTKGGYYSGFEIQLQSGYPWDTEEPEYNLNGIPMLPMLE